MLVVRSGRVKPRLQFGPENHRTTKKKKQLENEGESGQERDNEGEAQRRSWSVRKKNVGWRSGGVDGLQLVP